ncbi:MAG: TonB-dependent receptor plug domain-containing protein [Calditrichae bacterium]|nr:TonB-dependent receptor plug domain-containing protein [Calditrichia bacterium]
MRRFLLIFLIFTTFLRAADITIKGKVRHINTLQEISDVNVYIKSRPIGTTTNDKGEFTLLIPKASGEMIVVFDHVAYDTLQLSLSKAKYMDEFLLKPNLLQTNKITVEAKKAESEFSKDLPQSLTIIDAKEFEGRGYIDVGDLLRTDQSVQIEEDLSGKKVISMRAGNPEDVVVFYNGVKMNNNYDNVFDLSLLNVEDIQQVEIIKGSNTALFGSDAFSGVVNIIPKTKQNYTARFIQKFGSYDSGDWNLQLNHSITDNLYISYNQKSAGSKRPYSDGQDFLKNETTHHAANAIYSFPSDEDGPQNNLSLMYMRAELGYKNNRMYEEISDLNQIASLRYSGRIGNVHNLSLVAAYQELDNSQYIPVNITAANGQSLVSGYYDRHFFNDNYYLNLEKTFVHEKFTMLTAYQFENGSLDFKEKRTYLDQQPQGLESATLTRQKHGGVAILKMQTPTGSQFLESADINFSYRYDYILNQQKNVVERNEFDELSYLPGVFAENSWNENTMKFSTQLKGSNKDISYNVFLSTGNNVKFPTMFHQLSSPSAFDPTQPAVIANLNPEKNRSTEIGFEVIRETSKIKLIDGWQTKVNYFKNLYENKFRTYYQIGVPVAFYDNVANANLSGIEGQVRAFMFTNKLTIEFGASRYFISEKAAFPFKSDVKYTAQAQFDYQGYSARINWFSESDQVGWFRFSNGRFAAQNLSGYSNIDFHLSKEFDLDYFKLNTTFSARNILNDDTVLEGIAIRDRRFYIGFGLEY